MTRQCDDTDDELVVLEAIENDLTLLYSHRSCLMRSHYNQSYSSLLKW